MTNWSQLRDALRRQKEFSDLFFDPETLTGPQREETLKTFVLSLHAEATGIVEGVNYKEHRNKKRPVDVQKILYKSVDVYRYLLAILNLWGIGEEEFVTALGQKDDFLHTRHRTSRRKWNGEPVVVFDVDDVLAEFRKSFCAWLTETTGCRVDPRSKEYYATEELKRAGLNNEELYKKFLDGHGLLRLEVDNKYLGFLKELQSRGYWVQILTARPESNLTAFYDTYTWLRRNGIEADGVAFTPEKYTWLTDQEYFSTGNYFAVDDSAKHAAEYAKHGVRVVVPQKSYNGEVKGVKNVYYVDEEDDPVNVVTQLCNVG